jgi:APA family basic amino acid/polyamine antiporter
VKLASRRRRGIHVLSLLTVPTNLPLDADMGDREEDARSKIERVKLLGGLRVTGTIKRIRPGEAAHAIADAARAIKATAIVIPLVHRGGRPMLGKTLKGLLGERPCRVIVVSDPGESGLRAAA